LGAPEVGRQSEFDFRLTELSALGREAQCAGRCELAPTAKGEAVHGCDHRLAGIFEQIQH
jgi:hypothetical protein